MIITDNERLEQFKRECKIINLKYEYTGYKDDIQWAIVTELTEEELIEKYSDEINPYIPFIRLSVSQGEIFVESERNNHKHEERARKSGHSFDINDSDFDVHHPELAINDVEDSVIFRENCEMLRMALDSLTEIQKERIYKYYFENKDCKEIAEDEGVSHQAITQSIRSSLKFMKKFFK